LRKTRVGKERIQSSFTFSKTFRVQRKGRKGGIELARAIRSSALQKTIKEAGEEGKKKAKREMWVTLARLEPKSEERDRRGEGEVKGKKEKKRGKGNLRARRTTGEGEREKEGRGKKKRKGEGRSSFGGGRAVRGESEGGGERKKGRSLSLPGPR